MKTVVALTVLLTGCATHLPHPTTLKETVDPTALVEWNAVVDNKTQEILCPKCYQREIRPRWCRDPKGVELLLWHCRHCGADWATKPAASFKTIP